LCYDRLSFPIMLLCLLRQACYAPTPSEGNRSASHQRDRRATPPRYILADAPSVGLALTARSACTAGPRPQDPFPVAEWAGRPSSCRPEACLGRAAPGGEDLRQSSDGILDLLTCWLHAELLNYAVIDALLETFPRTDLIEDTHSVLASRGFRSCGGSARSISSQSAPVAGSQAMVPPQASKSDGSACRHEGQSWPARRARPATPSTGRPSSRSSASSRNTRAPGGSCAAAGVPARRSGSCCAAPTICSWCGGTWPPCQRLGRPPPERALGGVIGAAASAVDQPPQPSPEAPERPGTIRDMAARPFRNGLFRDRRFAHAIVRESPSTMRLHRKA
jgi:hypothetical protein